MDGDGMRKLEPAGIIDSKFGTVTLLRLVGGADNARSCLGFLKRVKSPFRISGCQSRGTIRRQSSRPPRRHLLHAEPADRAGRPETI